MEHFETVDDLANADLNELTAFISETGRCRFADPDATAKAVQAAARGSYRLPKTVNDTVNQAMAVSIASMRALKEQVKVLDKAIEQQFEIIPNTLTSIPGIGKVYSAGIIAEMDDEEGKDEYVKIINTNCDLLLRLVTDILDFSKIESGMMDYSLADVNIKEICAEQYKVHSLKVQKGVSMRCDLDALPDKILHTDPKRVTQVVSNLLSNAIKFTEQGSITLSYRVEEDHVLFEVSDTGIGISARHIETIFERFTKVDSFKQGTGLGLSICKTIVNALCGEIGVDSTPGVGSRFWFTLPCE